MPCVHSSYYALSRPNQSQRERVPKPNPFSPRRQENSFIMKEAKKRHFQSTMAARVAAEDIQPKDMVAVLSQVVELPSFFWACSGIPLPEDELIQLRFLPSDPGKPFKVTSICLPFVYVRDIRDKTVILDIRQHQLVRLDSKIARKVWKRLRRSLMPQ